MTRMTTRSVRGIADLPAVAKARAFIRRTDGLTIEEQRRLATIPAPPFGEGERGDWVAARMAAIGLSGVRRDREGNVLATIEGSRPDAEPVVVAAHLDTVFPAGTPLTVREEGRRICVPGIADNARGLAAVLAIARAAAESGIEPVRPVVLVATTGEEGIGDLRGVKHLFREKGGLRRAAAFIALDGTDSRRVVTSAVGSRRYRVTLEGAGGHAWADRGTASATHALGDIISALAALRPAAQPATSLNIGRVGGGTSINAVAETAWLELDLRGETEAALAGIEGDALARIESALAATNSRRRRGTGAVTAALDPIGSRPAGRTRPDTELVVAAKEATRYIGRRPELVASSTDANVPMALGIPAIAIGAGGESGGMHTVGEWYENRKGAEGIVRALLVVAGVAGVNGG